MLLLVDDGGWMVVGQVRRSVGSCRWPSLGSNTPRWKKVYMDISQGYVDDDGDDRLVVVTTHIGAVAATSYANHRHFQS